MTRHGLGPHFANWGQYRLGNYDLSRYMMFEMLYSDGNVFLKFSFECYRMHVLWWEYVCDIPIGIVVRQVFGCEYVVSIPIGIRLRVTIPMGICFWSSDLNTIECTIAMGIRLRYFDRNRYVTGIPKWIHFWHSHQNTVACKIPPDKPGSQLNTIQCKYSDGNMFAIFQSDYLHDRIACKSSNENKNNVFPS